MIPGEEKQHWVSSSTSPKLCFWGTIWMAATAASVSGCDELEGLGAQLAELTGVLSVAGTGEVRLLV